MADPTALPEGFFDRPLTGRQLGDFAQCPRRFLLTQFVSEKEDRRFRGAAAVLHQALRGAIVEFYRAGGGASGAAAKLHAHFEDLFEGELCADAMEEDRTRKRGLGMLDDFCGAWIPEHAEAADVDVYMNLALEQQAFAASADLVFPDDDGLLVIRLNSRRDPPSPAELAKETSARLLALAARDHYADDLGRVAYYSLTRGRLIDIDLADEQMAQFSRDIESRAARMRREVLFEPRKGRHCRWCRARSRCGVWQ